MGEDNAGRALRQRPSGTPGVRRKIARDTPSANSVFEMGNEGNYAFMKRQKQDGEEGAMGYIFLWLLGIPIPILLLFFLLRGCT
jgi:hypothetical protein